MSNYFLLKSTYNGLCIHLFFFILYYSNIKHNLIILYSFGLLTSILNHAYTNSKLMYLDRFTMRICFIHNFILSLMSKNYMAIYLMLVATMLYILQKKYNNESDHYFHYLAHILIVACNVHLYINY